MSAYVPFLLGLSRAVMVLLSAALIVRCLRSMLRERYDPEIWAFLRSGKDSLPITHWENLIGRSRSADLRLDVPELKRVQAVLCRGDQGEWTVYDVFSRGGVTVNGRAPGGSGLPLHHGDTIRVAGCPLHFSDIDQRKRKRLEEARSAVGRRISPALTLLELTVFQLFLLLQHVFFASPETLIPLTLSFTLLIILEWSCYNAMRIIGRSGFEAETLAFYLTSLGYSVAASSVPGELYKQVLLTMGGVLLFVLGGWWLRSLRRTAALRIPVALGALLLLGLNLAFSKTVFGARNWLEIGSFSFQPSELVKVAFVYVGASTLDRLYRRRNLFVFIAFSASCVIALAVLGDFGTALVFFVGFLVIAFLRSGSVATVFLALAAAGMAGFLAVNGKQHIAQRFASWGHIWEDPFGAGYQQTHALSAAASGGLFGKGAGNGWLKHIFAANTDLVFGMICEELGLLIGLCMIAAVLVLAFFAVRSARRGRSAYYAIAACAAMSMLLTQVGLNVFGSVDLLPFTGVTFPFVSRGGSSFLSCWMLMAFIKGADNRRDASFAVRPGERLRSEAEGG